MRIQLFFNHWESRELLARTLVRRNDLVTSALEDGIVAVGRGVTNAFILRELLAVTGHSDFDIDTDNYVAGIVTSNVCASDAATRAPEIIFRRGNPEYKPIGEVVAEMSASDVLIKGGNTLGPDFVAGVLVAHPSGGTIGNIYATAVSRGIKLIVPISLEKMVPFPIRSIINNLGGQERINYARGMPVGLFPVVGGEVFTEIEALKSIGDVSVYPIGSGGVHQGAGGVILELSGPEEEIKEVIKEFKHVINAKPLATNIKQCESCQVTACYKKQVQI
ncbi:MAG: hypothetical protein ACFFD4_08435 [Candidatus Odinarchaeota archaeon]